MTIKIIGFAGRELNGKSTVANAVQQHFFDNNIKCRKIPFAAPLKQMLISLGLTLDEVYGDQKETPNHHLLGGKTPRHAMQTLGTEWGRDMIVHDLWIRAWKRQVEFASLDSAEFTFADGAKSTGSVEIIIVDDVRFPNEVEVIRSLGGQVFAIQRYPDQATPEGHASTNLDFAANNIPIIDNSGTVEYALDQILIFL